MLILQKVRAEAESSSMDEAVSILPESWVERRGDGACNQMQEQEQGGLIQHLPPSGLTWNAELSQWQCLPKKLLTSPASLHRTFAISICSCPPGPLLPCCVKRSPFSTDQKCLWSSQDSGEGGMDFTSSVRLPRDKHCSVLHPGAGWRAVHPPSQMDESGQRITWGHTPSGAECNAFVTGSERW